MSEENKTTESNWQREAIEKLAMSSLAEQKVSRRWSTLFKALLFIYLFIVLFYALGFFGLGKKTQFAGIKSFQRDGVIELGVLRNHLG